MTATRTVLVAMAAALVVAGGAFGFWRGLGSGSAPASATTTQPVVVSPGTPGGRLYPGGQTEVAMSIANPNPFRVRVGSLSLDTSRGTGGFDVDGAHSGCGLSALTFTTQTNAGAGWSVAPRVGSTNGTLALDLANAIALSTTAASACQGASFRVYVTAGP